MAVAYGTQAPQLAVAEFAPTAQQALEAPPTTAAGNAQGAAAGGRRARATTTTTAPPSTSASSEAAAAPTTRVGRTRQCFGNPPRQTEDPMSPPCVATIYDGDNGGATTRGISSTEIRVAVPTISTGGGGYKAGVDALFEYFNQRYELYGRRLVPVYTQGTFSNALGARSAAAAAAAENVFAALTGAAETQIAQPSLPLELARQGVVTLTHNASTWWTDRTVYDAMHPYVWSAYPSAEDVQSNLADFACTSLAGRTAAHAGTPELRATTRRFAIASLGQVAAVPTGVLSRALEACTGVTPARIEWASTSSTNLRTAFEQLRSNGTTTVFCICEAGFGETAITSARTAAFQPEWVLTPSYWASGNDENWLQQYPATGAMAPPMRFSAGPKLLPLQARPWFGALQTVLASIPAGTSIYGLLMMGEQVYPAMLTLAAGIQGAGPDLTPDTFAAALMSTTFANPGTGQPPYWQPAAGFGPGDHSLFDDYAVGWWSNQAQALDTGLSPSAVGSWCYLDAGARFSPGTYPTDADQRLFNPDVPCR